MPSHIEKQLMIATGLFALVGIELRQSEVLIALGSWDTEERRTFSFKQAKILALENTLCPDDTEDEMQLPWDIIGFESEPLTPEQWRFEVVTNWLVLTFSSAWPEQIS